MSAQDGSTQEPNAQHEQIPKKKRKTKPKGPTGRSGQHTVSEDTFARIPEVFVKHAGNIPKTCQELGISDDTFKTWRSRYTDFDALMTKAAHNLVFGAFSIFAQLSESRDDEMKFKVAESILKKKGKGFGWAENHQDDQASGLGPRPQFHISIIPAVKPEGPQAAS